MVVRRLEPNEPRIPFLHLGIDESFIPFEYFEGIYKNEHKMVFTDDVFSEVQFIVWKDLGVKIVTPESGVYVTPEDLRDAEWFKIGSEYFELQDAFLTQHECEMDRMRKNMYDAVVKRYTDGESGVLEASLRLYDEHGDWMRSSVYFDTTFGLSLQERLHNHSSFLYRYEPEIPWQDRRFKMRLSEDCFKDLKQIVYNMALTVVLYDGNPRAMTGEDRDINWDEIRTIRVMLPAIGQLETVIDNRVKAFILEKQ